MGSFKARIHDSIGSIEVSVPSVVTGKMLAGRAGDGMNQSIIRLNTVEGSLIEIYLLYRIGK